MGLGVIRLEASQRLPDAALVDHVVGLQRPSTAHRHEHLDRVGVAVLRHRGKRFRRACRIAAAVAARQRGGRRPALSSSWLFAIGGVDTADVHLDESTIPDDAPATIAEGRPWTLADCEAFAKHVDERILSRIYEPGSYVLALHLDEKGVHAQAEGPAVVRGPDGQYRAGNNAVRETLVRLADGFKAANARARAKLAEREAKAAAADEAVRAADEEPQPRRRWIDKGPDHVYLTAAAQMRLVHDLYAEEFGRFGVERGKGGAKRHHERVDRSKAMDAKLRAVERERDAALERERQVVARAEAAEAREDQADKRAAVANRDADDAAQFREYALGERAVADIAADTARDVRDRRVDELRDAEARLDQVSEQRGVLEGEVAALRKQRSAEAAALRSDQEARAAVVEQRDGVAADRDQASREADEARATAQTYREEYRKAVSEASAELGPLGEEVTGLRRERVRLQSANEVAANENVQAAKERARLDREVAELRETRRREEEIGLAAIWSWLSRKGRQAIAQFRAARDAAEKARDQAQRARDKLAVDLTKQSEKLRDARSETTQWKTAAEARESERDAAQASAESLQTKLDATLSEQTRLRGELTEGMRTHNREVRDATQRGRAMGFAMAMGRFADELGGAASRLGVVIPQRLAEVIQVCAEKRVLMPMIDAGRPVPEQAVEVDSEQEGQGEHAGQPAPVRRSVPSAGGWER